MQPVLECVVQKGLVYNKVNPIFHHWRVDERKFGLTFQSPADAVSFEKGLQALIDKMDRGSDSPSSSSTPEEGDTEDDGQAVSTYHHHTTTIPPPYHYHTTTIPLPYHHHTTTIPLP
ncbi:hypothetical protein CRUP_016994 [Coryphaenoides rupestris]|nr:hypothetical protein CRUP_016994 [Coryphaenoides rupestris]